MCNYIWVDCLGNSNDKFAIFYHGWSLLDDLKLCKNVNKIACLFKDTKIHLLKEEIPM